MIVQQKSKIKILNDYVVIVNAMNDMIVENAQDTLQIIINN